MVSSVYVCIGNPKSVKRNFQVLEKRRFEAMHLLDQGLNQPETQRRLKVVLQTVSAWRRRYRWQGPVGLRRAGRKLILEAAQLERQASLLLEGAETHGFPIPQWTSPRVAHLIGDELGVDYHEDDVWKILRGSAGPRNERSAKCASAATCD